MGSIADQYVGRYYNEYDETDRYFDYVYDIYEQMSALIEEQGLYLLDDNNFADFFTFYTKHMNRELVDQQIISTYLRQLQHELGKSVGEIKYDEYIDMVDDHTE
jgi:hypothetical protein